MQIVVYFFVFPPNTKKILQTKSIYVTATKKIGQQKSSRINKFPTEKSDIFSKLKKKFVTTKNFTFFKNMYKNTLPYVSNC